MPSIWYDISPSRIQPEDFVTVIEVPKGNKKKCELNKETRLATLDRVFHTSTHYPTNYGFIPRIYDDDGDPLNMLILYSERIDSLALVHCYPIGYISMLDDDESDGKIIAIPSPDSIYNSYHDLVDLSLHLLDETEHFFSIYRALEDKQAMAKDVNDRAAVVQVIQQAMDHYAECFLSSPSVKISLYPTGPDKSTAPGGKGK